MTTSATAVGTVFNVALGVFNAWMFLRGRRVVLKVTPYVTSGSVVGGDPDTYETRITVANLGQFTVYLTEVGFSFRGANGGDSRVPVLHHIYPIQLEPRESVRFAIDPRYLLGEFARHPIRCAYVRTACGRRRTGLSPSLLDHEIAKANATGNTARPLQFKQLWLHVLTFIDRTLF